MRTESGSHGTCLSFAESIRDNGFRPGRSGIRGAGVYLWAESAEYLALARGWYGFRRDKGDYKRASDKECAVVIAKIVANEDEFFDLEDREVVNHISELSKRKGIDTKNSNDIRKVYEIYIRAVETKAKKEFKVLEGRVGPPPAAYCPEYPVMLLGAPFSYIIRDTAVIINTELVRCTI